MSGQSAARAQSAENPQDRLHWIQNLRIFIPNLKVNLYPKHADIEIALFGKVLKVLNLEFFF